MKIDVITFPTVNNYGSVLQAFATQEFFREHGCEVRILNYKRVFPLFGGNPLKAAVKFPFRLITQCIQPFDAFRRQYLNISGKLRRVMRDFADYESDADAFCTGSDQVWNSWYNRGILPEVYLAFAPEGSYKFAFSASFGKTEIDAQEVAETQKYIDDYRHISVREDSAVKILEEQYHYGKAVHVPDPTLCLSGNTWRGYVKTTNRGGAKESEPYILVYKINAYSSEFNNYAAALSRKTGLKIKRLCATFAQACQNFFRHEEKIILPPVFDIISLIDNARYVLTDSFHGTAFSLNLNTEPICIFPEMFGGRLESILRLTGTLGRRVTGYDDFGVLNRPVNWEHVNSVLDAERRKVSGWLDMVLAEIRQHNS